MSEVDERKPFEEIAKRKGKKLKFGKSSTASLRSGRKMHLDMDMVEESIRNAIARTSKEGKDRIFRKLLNLLLKGTDVDKVEFVLGSGTYYFPEDIGNMAMRSRASEGTPCETVCENVCWLVCECLTDESQECDERCREVCELVC